MFEIDFSKDKVYLIKLKNGFEVTIKPLSKSEDLKLEKEFSEGRIAMVKGKKRKDQDKILFPETDYFKLNLARAIKTWISWNLNDSDTGQDVELTKENIIVLFENFYDELALPIINKLDETTQAYTKEELEALEDEKKTY